MRDYEETIDFGAGILARVKSYYTENEAKIVDAVDKTIERIAGKSAERFPTTEIKYGSGRAHGVHLQYSDRAPIILWTLTHDTPFNTGGHEAMHHLRRMGFFAPGEWRTLQKAVVDNGWLDKYNIRKNYSEVGPATQLEEGVAHAFGEWVQHKFELDKQTTVIFRRMQELAWSIKIALKRALGKEITWQDLFHEAEQGDIKARTPSGPLDPKSFRPAFQKDEPPVEEGKVRLYRGDTSLPESERRAIPDYLKDNPEVQKTLEATGRWFTKDRDVAKYYNDTFGDKSGKVSYVDVARADADKYLSANQPEAAKFSAQGRSGEEHFVPREIADKAQPIGAAFQKDDEIFERATDAGMTKEEYKLYLRNIEQRQKEDQARIEKKALTEEKRKQGKEWKENEKRVEGEVRESIDNRPDFKAENFLRDGTLNGEKPLAGYSTPRCE